MATARGQITISNLTSVSISDKKVAYAISNDGTTQPSKFDLTLTQAMAQIKEGQYLWTKTTISYTDSVNTNHVDSYSVSRIGQDTVTIQITPASVVIEQKATVENGKRTVSWPNPLYNGTIQVSIYKGLHNVTNTYLKDVKITEQTGVAATLDNTTGAISLSNITAKGNEASVKITCGNVNLTLPVYLNRLGELQNDIKNEMDNSYSFLKKALAANETVITGGLVMSTMIALGYKTKVTTTIPATSTTNATTKTEEVFKVMAGISGSYENEHSVASWYGGTFGDLMEYDAKNNGLHYKNKLASILKGNEPKTVFRMDGSGYIANGNIAWDETGRVRINNFFFGNQQITDSNFYALLKLFSYATSPNNQNTIATITPNAAFTSLKIGNYNALTLPSLSDATSFWGQKINKANGVVTGSINLGTADGTYIQFGGVRLVYDSKNNAVRVEKSDGTPANFYSTGSLSAFGTSTISATGSGGLEGSIIDYNSAILLASEDITQVASAYSISKLAGRLDLLEGGSASKISVTGSGNAITNITKSGTTITATKGSTFALSSHSHAWSEITGIPDTFTPAPHTHSWDVITNKPSTFTPSTHSHGWSEITGKPVSFTPAAHTQAWSTITDIPTSFKPDAHKHVWADITDHPTSMPASDVSKWAKATTKPSYTWSEITGKPTSFAPSSHNHDGRYMQLFGGVNKDFNIADKGSNSGIYYANSSNTQSNKPATSGIIADFNSNSGHLQLFGGAANDLRARSYWQTTTSDFKYSDWVTLIHSGNIGSQSVNYAKSAGSVAWADVSGRPTSLPASDVSGWAKAATKPSYGWGEITGKPATFAPSSHSHSWDSLTGKPASFTPSSHNHTSLTGVTSISFAADASDSCSISTTISSNATHLDFNLSDDAAQESYRWIFHDCNTSVGKKTIMELKPTNNAATALLLYGTAVSVSGHGHGWNEISGKPATATRWPAWGEVTGKPTSMPASDVYNWAKAASKPSYSWGEITGKPTSMPASDVSNWAKATSKPSYGWGEITGKPATFAPSSHSHAWGDLTGVPTTASRWPAWSEVTNKPGSMPASDVYAWAKASTKPSYSWSEITGKPTSMAANGGTATTANYLAYCTSTNGSKNTYPYHRILSSGVQTGDWVDLSGVYEITQGYQGGAYGIFKVALRTNQASKGGLGGYSITWIVRYGFAADKIVIGFNNVAKNHYLDVYFKNTGGYEGIVVNRLQSGGRGGVSECFTMVNSSEADNDTHTECYSSITTATTSPRKYTDVAKATDGGTVSYANSAGSVAWGNVSGRPGSLPASDVYGWAKASSKPSYSWSEITGKPGTFTPSSHNHDGRYIYTARGTDQAIDSTGYWAAMTTQSGITKDWWHVLSMDWNGSDNKNWISQLALPTRAVNGMYYRSAVNGNSITTGAWVKVWDVNNLTKVSQLTNDSGYKNRWPSWSEVTNKPGSMPASDVYAWAKASSKPSYSWSEITGKPGTFTPSSHNHDGRYFQIFGGVDKNFNIPDNASSGLYYIHSDFKQTNASETYGLIADFEYQAGHLQFFGGIDNNIKVRSYWWTNGKGFAYNGWVKMIHSGNIGSQSVNYATSSNTANLLKTSRSIWGNSFNGTANITGEAKFSEANGFRLNYGSYGVIHRNDGGAYWILLTNKGDQNGGFNGLRPFSIDLATGTVSMNNNAMINYLLLSSLELTGNATITGSMIFKGAEAHIGRNGTYTDPYSGKDAGFKFSGTICSTGLLINGDIVSSGSITAYTTSDSRKKTSIVKADSISILKSLGGTYEFDWKDGSGHSIGFIAQNVQKSQLSEMVYETGDKTLKLNYLDTRLISLAVGGIIQIDDELTTLKKRISELEQEIKTLKQTN